MRQILSGMLISLVLAGCGGSAASKGPATAGQVSTEKSQPSGLATTAHSNPAPIEPAATTAEKIPASHSSTSSAPPSAAATTPAASPAKPTDDEIRTPATVEEAAKAIDLATFPLLPGATEPGMRVVASLGYDAPADVKTAYEFQRKNLLDHGWKELSDAQIYDQSGSGQFGKGGYHVSVSIFPRGEAGRVSIRLQNHSNVNLSKLPAPPGTKFQYAFPGVASFVTEATVDDTTAAVRKLLLDRGWQPYGSAGDVMTLKQNAVLLSARVLAPPAQPGKTVIDYSAVQMSADLPAPPDADSIQYADQLKQLNVIALGVAEEVAKTYQALLAPAGWKATTEKPIRDKVESFMIFRNPAKEMLTLNMWDLREEQKTRVTLNHNSAAEVEELDRKAHEYAAEQKRKREEMQNKPKPKWVVTLPAGAAEVQADKREIEFQLPSGKAKPAIEALVEQLTAAGWKAEDPLGNDMAGVRTFKLGEQSITIQHVDPGFIPAQITITGSGVELERKASGQ